MYLVGGVNDPVQFNELYRDLGEERFNESIKWNSFVMCEDKLSDALAVDIQLSEVELVWIRLKYPNVVVDNRVVKPIIKDSFTSIPVINRDHIRVF